MKRNFILFLFLGCTNLLFAQVDSTKKTKSEALTFCYQLYERINKGESFAELAKKYSEDPGSAPQGGVYANINRGEFIPKFEEVLFKLKPKQISRPFKTEYGYHIVELLSQEGNKYTCRHILITYTKTK
jgi:peptidyl-prolyl cis-trans isomerase SurA